MKMLSQATLAKFTDYLRLHDCSNATIDSYQRTIIQLVKYIGKPPHQIVQEDLDRYRIYLREKYSQNTLTPKIAAVNMFMKFLGKPYRLSAPKKIVKNKDPLTVTETKALLEAAKYNPRDYALLMTLYYSQLRRSEIINLNIDDIDWERQKIRVNKGKGNDYSTINIHPDALEAIKRYLKERGKAKEGHENALFLNKYGYRLGKTAIAHMVKKYAAKAGIEKRVYPHLFRISSITHMAENGATLEEIRRQSRHKDLKTLTGYIQLADQHVKEVYIKTLPSFNGEELHKENSGVNRWQNQPDIQNKEQILIDKLINGEISSEAFIQALNLLRQKHSTTCIQGYI